MANRHAAPRQRRLGVIPAPRAGRDAAPTAHPTSRPARTGAVLAVLAAAGWLAESVDSVARPGPVDGRDLLFVVPWTLTLGALAAVHVVQRRSAGRLERVGWWSATAAMLASVPGILAWGLGSEVLDPVTATATLAWLPAMVAFGVGTVRAGVLPPRVGIAITVSQPGAVLAGVVLSPVAGLHAHGSYSGAVAHAVTLGLVAAALRSHDRRHR